MSEHSKSKGKHVVPKKFTVPKSFIKGSKPKIVKKEDAYHQIKINGKDVKVPKFEHTQLGQAQKRAKEQTPFYKTGISRSPFNFGDFTETGPGRTKKQDESEVTSHIEENNASLGRSTRQRKIDNLKGKLTDVKAKTMSLASESKKTGDAKEVMQKDAIISRKNQAKRIEKRINRKEGREERKAIKKSLKGKENRGERRKQIILSRQNQYKKRKAVNQNTSSSKPSSSSSSTKKDKKEKITSNGSSFSGGL